jgi:tripartite ATP-independent transporter DctP family solute receptor
MKKRLVFLFGMIAVVFLAACGAQTVGEPQMQAGTRSNMPVIDPVTIRFGHAGPDDPADQIHYGALAFAQRVSELSGGAMQVNVYPASALGNDGEMVNMLRSGTLHMLDAANAPLTPFVPEAMWVDLPYIIQSYEHAEAVFDARSGVSRWIRPIYVENGFRIMGVYHTGFRHMMNNVRPINHPSDMIDTRMRVMNSAVMIATLEAFGSIVTTQPFAEVYGLIAAGVIDGNEQPLGFVYSMNFFEVQPYLSMTGHFYNPRSYIFSEELWQQLTSAQQLVIIDATYYAVERMNAHHHANQAIIMQNIINTGMQVTHLTSASMNAFIEAGATVWPMFFEAIGSGNAASGSVMIDMIQSYIP